MDKDTRAINTAENATQPESMPSSEQKTAESEQTDSPAQSNEVQTNVSEDKEMTLPEGTSERTAQQFEKLKETNRVLKEQLESQTIEPLSPFPSVPQTPSKGPDQYYDPDTGIIGIDYLRDLERDLQRTKQNVQTIQAQSDQQQESEAYAKYPELKTDPKLRNLVQATVVQSMINPQAFGGKQLSLTEAAEYVKTPSNSDIKKAEQQGAKEAIESLTPKEQASLEATGRSDKRSSAETQEALRQRTRRGDSSAIHERLKNIPMA